jgi:hypothetical protein
VVFQTIVIIYSNSDNFAINTLMTSITTPNLDTTSTPAPQLRGKSAFTPVIQKPVA